jgi:processive 1,2-diacylglycerol beta-glucosyltransferase
MAQHRVLVLTSSTGSGHDMRARAFTEWVRISYPDSVEVHTEQIIENASALGRFGVWVYNTIHRFCPALHNIYFFIVEAFIASHARSVSFGGTYYRKLLQDYRPTVILSVHDSTNRGYFEDARRLLGTEVRCVTYCGEFSGGYGYSRNWLNPTADCFIARTGAARDYAVAKGIPADRSHVFHKFLPPEAFTEANQIEFPEAAREQLGLKADRFTLFLATGGFGANHHLDFLKALLPLAGQVQVIVVCGRNQQVFERLSRWKEGNPQLDLYIEGYSTRIADFMQISHAIVTRGGANTTMEALHFGCPLLYNAMGGLMPQERCTVRYFLQHEAARLLRSPNDLRHIVEEWAPLGEAYTTFQSNLSRLHFEEDPRDLIDLILGHKPGL